MFSMFFCCFHEFCLFLALIQIEVAHDTEHGIDLHVRAARHCAIQPHHFVLEIGFETGTGLQEVVNLLKGTVLIPIFGHTKYSDLIIDLNC